MLARENRLVSADDFRSTTKSGRRASTQHLVVYLKRDEVSTSARFGFVVGKVVGGAVQRNLVKRRLRAVARELLSGQVQASGEASPSGENQPSVSSNSTVVVRALPGAAQLPWNKLRAELLVAVSAASKQQARS